MALPSISVLLRLVTVRVCGVYTGCARFAISTEPFLYRRDYAGKRAVKFRAYAGRHACDPPAAISVAARPAAEVGPYHQAHSKWAINQYESSWRITRS